MSGRKQLKRAAFVTIFGIMITSGITGIEPAYGAGHADKPPITAAQSDTVYQGKITGVSKKAKSISISVGKGDQAKMMMVKYDDATQGMEHAKDGEAAIITFELRGTDKVATDIKPKLATLPEGIKEIQPVELIPLVTAGPEKGNFVLVDSRPTKRYDDAHIPGAISIQPDDVEGKGAALLPADKTTPLIFYCGGVTCGLSPASAATAKKMGYTNIKVLLKGVPGWKKAGQTLVASDSFIEKGNIVLVDVRTEAESAAGHIPRAVNIPLADLAASESDFPVKAPVVVYGNGDDAIKAYKMIGKWGLKTVALVEGGLEGYVARGHQVVSGTPETEISWTRILGKGEIGLDAFRKAAEAGGKNVIILDVRTPEEIAGGKLTGAVTIPLDLLEAKIGELPKDKEIITYCSTGARAEMAYQVLVKNGYKSQFLVADVACEGDGNCSIE